MRRTTTVIVLALMIYSATAFAAGGTYTLNDAYEQALKTNETLKLSQENVLQAESRVDQARSFVYPRVTANGAYTHYNDVLPPGGGGFIFQPLNQVNASIVLTQPLYTGGRTMAAWRAANMMREASTNDLSSVKQAILFGVAEAYYAVIKAEKQVDVNRNSLERMERHKKVTERDASRRRTKANQSALLRANTLVNQARIGLVRTQDGLKIARQKLNLISGLPENIETADPEALAIPPETLTELQENALKNRDDYVNSQLRQKIAGELVTITRGAHYAQVYAEGGVRYQDSSPETELDATTYYGGVRLQIPLFEGGLMKAEDAEAHSQQRQSELASELLKRRILDDVHEAYINLQTVSAVLETARLQLEDARKYFDTVEELFSEGLAPSVSLIDAESALSVAEREVVSATWDRQVSILRLRKSMGLMGKEERSETSAGSNVKERG